MKGVAAVTWYPAAGHLPSNRTHGPMYGAPLTPPPTPLPTPPLTGTTTVTLTSRPQGGTYGGNAVACAAAAATIDVINNERLCDNAAERGRQLTEGECCSGWDTIT